MKRNISLLKLAKVLARVLPVALFITYFGALASHLAANGGLERYARMTDFMPTLAAAQLLADGRGDALFDLAAQREAQAQVLAPYLTLADGIVLPFLHPPYEALAILPLMSLSYVGVTLLWVVLGAIALGSALVILQRTLPIKGGWLVVLILCLVSYQPVFRAFALAQNSMLVLLGICLTFASVRRAGTRWELLAGTGLILVSLKLQVLPLVLLLVLLEGRWKAILWFGVEMAVLIITCMPFLGSAWPLRYVALLREVSQWSANAAINPAIMHNWRGFATDTVGLVSASGADLLVTGLTMLSLLLFAYAWWQTRRARHAPHPGDASTRPVEQQLSTLNLLWALGIVTAILIASHLHPHDLTLLIFPAWIVVYSLQTERVPPRLRLVWIRVLQVEYGLMVVTFFVSTDALISVVVNVALLALSTGLLLLTIQVNPLPYMRESSLHTESFDMATARD